ncbi:Growth inhibitor [Polaromonas sp. CG9_12]|nr:Growth inhibitor [Polaromonas sp. CG9_12]
MALSVAVRVQKRRDALRMAGLRPVQIWVPDTRRPDFAAECRRQSRLAAQADMADVDLLDFMDDALADADAGAHEAGDFVTIAMQGDFGKPRPALIIQSDQFNEHASVTVLLVSSALVAAPLLRVTVQPNPENGLQKPSQVMVDKAMTVKKDKLGEAFGI